MRDRAPELGRLLAVEDRDRGRRPLLSQLVTCFVEVAPPLEPKHPRLPAPITGLPVQPERFLRGLDRQRGIEEQVCLGLALDDSREDVVRQADLDGPRVMRYRVARRAGGQRAVGRLHQDWRGSRVLTRCEQVMCEERGFGRV